MQSYSDASNQLKTLDMNNDSLFLQRLKSLEYWIEETRNHVAKLSCMYRDCFAWDHL
ncbi:hypothetical protein M3J09_003970 [Ascochyta lentis]